MSYREPIRRTLPKVETAYPRVGKITQDPMGGLASVEALYLARLMLGRGDDAMLSNYYWRDDFIGNLRDLGLV